MPDDTHQADKSQIPTNMRLLLLLEEVARAGVPVAPSTLVEALDLPKPTIHRLLTKAEQEGFLQRDVDGRSYGPGQRLRRLSTNTLSSQRMRTERLLIMKGLSETVGETCNLAAPGRFAMVYLDRVETHWPLRIQFPVGTEVPFHCTASGKMYLSSLRSDKLDRLLGWLELEPLTSRTITDKAALKAELAQTRKRGYATDDVEFMADMVAIAVPIRDVTGRLLTTLSIHAPTQRHSAESLVEDLGPLRETAVKLETLVQD